MASPTPGGGSTDPRGAAGTTRRARKPSPTPTATWETWWALHQEEFLVRRRDRFVDGISERSDYSLGISDSSEQEILAGLRSSLRLESWGVLEAALTDDDHETRAAAVMSMGRVGGPGAFAALLRGLRDNHRSVQESACLGLGFLTGEDVAAVLREVLGDTATGRRLLLCESIPTRTRSFAAIGLGLSGSPRALVPLLDAARSSRLERDIRLAAVSALGSLADDQARPLLVALARADSDPAVRVHAVTSIGKIGERSALPLIEELLFDREPDVARGAALAAALLGGPDDARLLKILEGHALRGSDSSLTDFSLIALGRIGSMPARRILRITLEEGRSSNQAFAALALGLASRGGEDHPEDRLAVRRAFARTGNDGQKSAYAVALGLLRDTESAGDLVEIVASSASPLLRSYAAKALGLMEARVATDVVREAFRQKASPDLQHGAAVALGLLGDRGAVALLAEEIRGSKSSFVVSTAAITLGLIQDPVAVPVLVDIARDPTRRGIPRAAAVAALGMLGDPRPVSALHAYRSDCNYLHLYETLEVVLRIL